MSLAAIETVADTSVTRWLHGLWVYYQGYTQTAVHAASAAALTAFGLLIFVDWLFAVLAIIAYVCPPIILYSLDSDVGRPSSSSTPPTRQGDSGMSSPTVPESGSDTDDGDTDSDSDDGDTDSDSDDGDTDSDGLDSDTDRVVSDATR